MSADRRDRQARRQELLSGAVFDACVVGSGAGGAMVAHELARAGCRVAIVEQGEMVPPGTKLEQLPAPERCMARDLEGRWVDGGNPWTACAVGGGTRFFCGISFRMREADFDTSHASVAGALDPRWPFDYAELRPYYDEAERLVGVARSHDSDPSGPPAAPAPFPPHGASRRGRAIGTAAAGLGLSPFPTPLAIRSVGTDSEPACREDEPCDEVACPVGAKGDVATRVIARLVLQPHVTLATGTRALRLLERGPGEIAGLECLDLAAGSRFLVRARSYVLAANAIQTAALLLRSRSRWSPDGLGNRSGLVGRGLCLKPYRFVKGRSRTIAATAADREESFAGPYSTVAISDYYNDPDAPNGLGGMIYEANPCVPQRPGDGVLLRLECLVSDQPLARNRIRLTKGRDAAGMPRLALDYRPHADDLARLDHLAGRAGEILRAAGVSEIELEPLDFTLGSGHLHGTCRAGADPATAVVDPDGSLHDAEAVVVADGAFQPFPGAVNPTLTIQANALRVGRRLASRLTPAA